MTAEAFAPDPVMVREAPGWVRALTGVVVFVVAVIAFIGSYGHMVEVGLRVGEGWLAYLTPIAVDGLAIAASMVLLVRRRSGQPGGFLARLSQLAALVVSLAANGAAAEPTLGARAWGVLPPAVLFLAYELLLQQVRVVQPAEAATATPEPPSVPRDGPAVFPAPDARPVPHAAPVQAYIEDGHARPAIPEHTGPPEPTPAPRKPRPARKATVDRTPDKPLTPRVRALRDVAIEITDAAGGRMPAGELLEALKKRGETFSGDTRSALMRTLRDEDRLTR